MFYSIPHAEEQRVGWTGVARRHSLRSASLRCKPGATSRVELRERHRVDARPLQRGGAGGDPLRSAAMRLASIEVVEDRTKESRCDEGFLRLARLLVRNRYEDGSVSETYPCDVVSRPGSDAVVAVLFQLDGERRIRVLLRESTRAPVYLRRGKSFVHPDPREYRDIAEVVAGIVEASDPAGPTGMRRRAALEAEEEAGCAVAADQFELIGGETFASPGTSDEKVYYCAAPAALDEAKTPRGDGSVMEEHARVVVCPLDEAIERCRSGEIPDMKTEIALLRLADHLGYLPSWGASQTSSPPSSERDTARSGSLGARQDLDTSARRARGSSSCAPGVGPLRRARPRSVRSRGALLPRHE